MNYKILESTLLGGLEFQVRKHIENGWEPLGSPTLANMGYIQAMIKHDALKDFES